MYCKYIVCVVLCFVVLCCVVCVVLCCVVLCCVVLCCVVSCCVVCRVVSRCVVCSVVSCRHNDVYGGHVAVWSCDNCRNWTAVTTGLSERFTVYTLILTHEWSVWMSGFKWLLYTW